MEPTIAKHDYYVTTLKSLYYVALGFVECELFTTCFHLTYPKHTPNIFKTCPKKLYPLIFKILVTFFGGRTLATIDAKSLKIV